MDHHRMWTGGTRVVHNGFSAMLIGPTWGQFAWIIYDGHANPDTVLASELTRVDDCFGTCVKCSTPVNAKMLDKDGGFHPGAACRLIIGRKNGYRNHA